MKTFWICIILIAASQVVFAGDDRGPYDLDKSDPSNFDTQTIDDYDNPGGKFEPYKKPGVQKDPCIKLRKEKKKMDKAREEMASTVEEACISDAQKCATLRKRQRELDKQYPKMMEEYEKNSCG